MNELYSNLQPGTPVIPDNIAPALGIDTSEFIEQIWNYILKKLYDSLYGSLEQSFDDLFSILNNEVSKAAGNIKGGPAAFGGGTPFATIQGIAENVCIPLAAAFITVIFCWELIHLVQESNSMNHVKPDRIMIVLMKFALCLLVCAKSFDIIMGFYDVGAWAVKELGQHSASDLAKFTYSFKLSDVLERDPKPGECDLGMLMTLCGYKIMLFLSKIGIAICGVIVYIRIMIWFLELLLYAAAAPIPYSTWINKDWSQVGMNYTRKMLALVFEGFFMLLLFAIYGGVVAGISYGDFMQSMVMIIGCGFALAIMMFKTGNISASIFNAH